MEIHGKREITLDPHCPKLERLLCVCVSLEKCLGDGSFTEVVIDVCG